MSNRIALVIGGGIAGTASALFLQRAGYKPLVFEAHAEASDIGGGLQIAPNGMHVLQQLGLAESLLNRGVESAEMCFHNQFGKSLGCIPNGPANLYSSPAVQVSRSILHANLLNALGGRGISVQYGKRLVNAASEREGVVAKFADGTSITGSILIGADGIHSQTRRIVFPDTPSPTDTGLITIGGFARHEALRPKDERDVKKIHMIFGQNGFFGYGYYDGSDPCSVMWWSHIQRDQIEAESVRRSEDVDHIRDRLLERHRGWMEPVELILRSKQRLLYGPVYDLPSIPRWHKERMILVGDAAHATSPHAGQGASLALEDALLLANRLKDIGYEEAFPRFERERRRRVEKIVAEARKRGEAKHSLSPGEAKVRDTILSLILRFRGKLLNKEAYGYRATWS